MVKKILSGIFIAIDCLTFAFSFLGIFFYCLCPVGKDMEIIVSWRSKNIVVKNDAFEGRQYNTKPKARHYC